MVESQHMMMFLEAPKGCYLLGEEISDGAQGIVFNVIHTISERKYVAKITEIHHEAKKERFINEINILQKLKGCKRVIQLKDHFIFENKGVVILEKMANDLMSVLESNTNSITSNRRRLKIFHSIVKAVKGLHKKGIAHLDLKPENILISSDLKKVKLCDFGNSRILSNDCMISNSVGTMLYSAPEIHNNTYYDGMKADMWSLGILWHVLVTNHWPFECAAEQDVLKTVALGNITYHSSMGENQVKICDLMLQFDPQVRCDSIELASILKHEFEGRYTKKIQLPKFFSGRLRST